jgi:hypothetical protein
MAEWHGFLRGMDFDIWLCVKMKASLSNSCEATTTPQAETDEVQKRRRQKRCVSNRNGRKPQTFFYE